MVNDGSSHYLQGQSIKRTVSEQASLLVCEFYPDKTSLFRVGIAFAVASFGTWGTQGGFSNEEATRFHNHMEPAGPDWLNRIGQQPNASSTQIKVWS
jgi:hypothetical protein